MSKNAAFFGIFRRQPECYAYSGRWNGSRPENGVFATSAALLLTIGFLLMGPAASFAVDFSAEVVDVDGPVTVFQKASAKTLPAAKGMKLDAGDVVETKAGGEAELLYEDGNVTRMDENTKLTIVRLSVEEDKSRQTVLALAVGRVKNSVGKLATRNSTFEVHSRTAVAGVTGTPPWTVGVFGPLDGEQKVEVDLMPNTTGETTNGVFVKGTDPAATMVILFPGSHTVALPGMPPVPPMPISAARLVYLTTSMKIVTTPKMQEDKKLDMDRKLEKAVEPKKEEIKKEEPKPAEPEKKTEAAPAPVPTVSLMDHISNNVSVGKVVTGVNVSGDTQGASALPGANTTAVPAMATVRVQVIIK